MSVADIYYRLQGLESDFSPTGVLLPPLRSNGLLLSEFRAHLLDQTGVGVFQHNGIELRRVTQRATHSPVSSHRRVNAVLRSAGCGFANPASISATTGMTRQALHSPW